jgi:heme/copper-type cytochrome/quinol oxidase subunit 2
MSVRPSHHETNPELRGTTIRTAWATLIAFAILAAMLVFTLVFAHMSRG